MPETDTIPVSASTASTGLGVRYIGNWAYCLSGTFDANTNQQTTLDFTSGSGVIVAKFLLTQFVREDTVGSTETTVGTITFNGETVTQVMVGHNSVDSPSKVTVPLIIPPFTVVTVTLRAGTTAATRQATVSMAGRVYGAE